ncbi:C3a anaphylatoxin chemotactic receptor [Microcaecilia unicolor]|uniref:C3a anaphylatoxin chemotactic receptor n=1 Tax=Microcaecilia unicolor TaxID=1415580 RepID=A0A6P7WJN9_9AMPH|nr:C3a anaphylatoxin chemotactic receptor [Microcaecilia unicolor]XP_030043538.1 C3a anaphylatoxin chemotactic receptor [Microcaecilia unicolor]
MLTTQGNHSTDFLGDVDPLPPEYAVTIAIYALTCLLGLPGNALVIWVAGFKMRRTVNTVWFLNLALADFLCCLSLPFSIANLVLKGNWPYGAVLCKLIPSAVMLNMFASVFQLVVISADRCLLVIKPVWSQNHRKVALASALCLGVWCLAFLMCVPVFLYRETTESHGKTTCEYNYYSKNLDYDYGPTVDYSSLDHMTLIFSRPNEDHKDASAYSPMDRSTINSGLSTVEPHEEFTVSNLPDDMPGHGQLDDLQSFLPKTELYDWYNDYSFTENLTLKIITFTRAIFGFLVPFSIILACYISIVWKVRGAKFAKSHGKTVRVVFSVVAAFFFCWIPYHVLGILVLYVNSPMVHWLDHMSQALAIANSCVNPLLYVFTGRDFKEKIHKSLRGIFESAFSEEVTQSTAPSRSKTRSFTDDNMNSTVV